MKKSVFILIFIFLPFLVQAQSLGEKVSFFVEESYDLEGRSQLSATLRKISNQLYFYLDDQWWEGLTESEKNQVNQALDFLALEFEGKIYPTLTGIFGTEWKPGIDNDLKITLLFHPLPEEAGGYFRTADEYSRSEFQDSNQREMLYLNAKLLGTQRLKSYLAHEFMHLITFNQKEKTYQVSDEVWLNELRAEYVSTLLGYDSPYSGSNLEHRVSQFLEKPYDPLTEWQNQPADYGVLNLFSQYLVDHYGLFVLRDSLKTSRVGIPSLNQALKAGGFSKDFSQIFTDWTIAVMINDCKLGEKYCYLNQNLKNLKVVPFTNYLPQIGDSVLSITNTTKNWAGNWHKFVGGKGSLSLEFDGDDQVKFVLPYLLQDKQGNYQIKFLDLDSEQRGTILISDFGKKYHSLTILPSIQSKISGFDDFEPFYQFSLKISLKETEEDLILQLLARIDYLKKEIQRLKNLLARKKMICQKFEQNLYYGLLNNQQVRCLQQFLKNQGPEIYPEGLVTGNYLDLTLAAVKRYQEKYAEQILKPLGLKEGTGYFGPKTRAKVNQQLGW